MFRYFPNLLGILVISTLWNWGLGINPSLATSETRLNNAQNNLTVFLENLPPQDRATLNRTSTRNRIRLSPRLRKKYDEHGRLKSDLFFWRKVEKLKQDLLSLPTLDSLDGHALPDRVQEAEAIAVTAIHAFGVLKEKYQMGNSALLHNLSIHMGLKKEGYCWHWTRDLLAKFKAMKLKTFDLYWATAREGTIREHNTVVLTPKGQAFNAGIFLDGWRKAGKPFWMKVSEDEKHPWVQSSE